nr:Agrin [Biomphalaria glabrata]
MRALTITVCVCLLVIALASVLAQAQCPMFCPRIYAPVCASNGQTYANECEMRLASCEKQLDLTLAKQGPC